jgi:hypothetical protein
VSLLYVKVGVAFALVLAIFGGGYRMGYSRYLEYKAEVEVAAKAQEAHDTAVQKQQDIVNQGIKNEYEAKLAAVRNFYSSGVRNPSSGSMSGISPAPKGTDAETAYPILARQCAEATAQLTSLQDWVNQQVGIK